MASIKWSNYKVVCTGLGNQIVIGKLENKQPVPGLSMLADKSEDRTREVISAVAQHMNTELKDGEEALNFKFEGIGTLTWTPEKK
jgi:hypothetical protein